MGIWRRALRVSLLTSTHCVPPLGKGHCFQERAIACEVRLPVCIDKLTELAIIILKEHKYMNRYAIALATLLIATLSMSPSRAQEDGSVMNEASINPNLSDRVQFRVGPFFAKWNSTVEVEGQDFDLDDRLGESDTVLAIGGFARVTNRIRFNFGYWASSREDVEILGTSTPVGPIVLPPGTQFDKDYEMSSVRGGLGWAFVSNDQMEVGIDVGLNLVTFKNNLTARFPGAPPLDLVSVDDTEPMGTIGVFFQYAFTPQWSLAGRAGALGFDLGNIEGEIYGGEVRLEYRPFRNMGLGIAYTYENADVTLKDDPANRNFTYTAQGAFAYLMFGFGSVK